MDTEDILLEILALFIGSKCFNCCWYAWSSVLADFFCVCEALSETMGYPSNDPFMISVGNHYKSAMECCWVWGFLLLGVSGPCIFNCTLSFGSPAADEGLWDEGRVLLNHDSWLLFLGCQLQCYINAKIQDWIIDEECTHSAWKGRSAGSAGDMRMDTSLATWNCLQAGAAVCDALVSLTKNAQLDSISSWRSSVSNAEVVTDVISFGQGGCLSQGHWPHKYCICSFCQSTEETFSQDMLV